MNDCTRRLMNESSLAACAITASDSVLVALSGGADSTALLLLMVSASEELGCRLHACHVNHGARPTAGEDAAFCFELCRAHGVDLVVEGLAEPPPRGVSRESWWRQQRYARLDAVRARLGCAAVLTAHTADDQAETVLLKLARGAGPRGVAGVRLRRPGVGRPLLGVRRSEIRAWLVERGASWCEDASNADLAQPRAWVRHVLLPSFESRFPRTCEHLVAWARMLAEDEDVFGALLAEVPLPALGRSVGVASVAALLPAFRHRWLLAVAATLPLAEPPGRPQLEAVSAMLDGGRPAAVDLGRHWVLRRRRTRLLVCPPPVCPFEPRVAAVPSRHELGGGLRVSLGEEGTLSERVVHRGWLAPVLGAVVLRWRPPAAGEMVTWEGCRGKVSALLACLGVPAEWRRAWPLLEADGTMVWIPGVGTDPAWTGEVGRGVLATLEEPWKRHVR